MAASDLNAETIDPCLVCRCRQFKPLVYLPEIEMCWPSVVGFHLVERERWGEGGTEREGERGGERERGERGGERERERHTQRQTETQREGETPREGEREGDRDREREI